ncbi:hypothetical protein DFA_11053 [Cavenderia fasciculata]|uniref:RING-type domain-containing protein n=1 Tax=Cavenderia fasciculata TaxID=261658 RepID=F4QEH9_CACFS|nr:uncharacterized protein DFA_11053 [Cavenderia fasciculata]EGG13292.1 hypothetical protein DFA_11053 [Cavenderia fasciculata]|eukprot:XP_004349991.1 hypothetical protein DFA_11053 [Cavenderia fasciculata]
MNEIFPYLVPTDNSFTEYCGYIVWNNKQYPVEIGFAKEKTTIEECKFNCSEELSEILSPFLPTIKNRLQQSNDTQSFLLEFKDILNRIKTQKENEKESLKNVLPFEVYTLVLREIDQIGWNRVLSIDKSFCNMEIVIRDQANRDVLVDIAVPSNYPVGMPLVKCLLPCNIVPPMMERDSKYSLPNIIDYIQAIVVKHQTFFDVMDEIDKSVWVIEPEKPNRSHITRRIVVANNCTLLININPINPRSFPDFQCAICYSHRLVSEDINNNNASSTSSSGTIPDKTCNNIQCNRQFHRVCLLEYFKTLPNSRSAFNSTVGDCPYCQTQLSCQTN